MLTTDPGYLPSPAWDALTRILHYQWAKFLQKGGLGGVEGFGWGHPSPLPCPCGETKWTHKGILSQILPLPSFNHFSVGRFAVSNIMLTLSSFGLTLPFRLEEAAIWLLANLSALLGGVKPSKTQMQGVPLLVYKIPRPLLFLSCHFWFYRKELTRDDCTNWI